MKAVDVIKELESTTSRLEKEAIVEKAWNLGCMEFFEGCIYAFDSMITFGYKEKSIPMVQVTEGEDDLEETYDWKSFIDLAEKLKDRKLTGHTGIAEVQRAALGSKTDDWNLWRRRILLKDLKCGISDTTTNKILKQVAKTDPRAKKYIVEKFEIQLATAIDNQDEKAFLTGKKLLDAKYDGVRILAFLNKEKGVVELRTRPGHLQGNVKHIIDSLYNVLEELPGSIVLDGELYSHEFEKPFQSIMTLLNRKKFSKADEENVKKVEYLLFDIIPLSEFYKGKSSKKLTDRHNALESLQPILEKHCSSDDGEQFISVIPKVDCDFSTEDGFKVYEQFKLQALDYGYEGIMVKEPDGIWQKKRSKDWLKFKPWITCDLTITKLEPGKVGTRHEHTVGNVLCQGDYEGRRVEVSVGSGWSDAMRLDMKNNPNKYIGRIAEIRGDVLTQAQGASSTEVWSLRFPRFDRFREDKS